jgi:hypothetical protein
LSLESRVKQSFKERKAATVKDGWLSGQETVFLLGFSSLVNHGNLCSCFS